MMGKLERLLAHRRIALAAALIAALLVLPTLSAGYLADDLVHRLIFTDRFNLPGGVRGDWDLFRFQGPDRANLHAMMELGIWPWWTSPGIKLAFFRPLSAYTHALDYRLLSAWPAILHAESIAIFAGTVYAASRFYVRVLPRALPLAWLAGLAAILFAVDHTRAMPVTWLANRNALLAALFSFTALIHHDRARKDGDRRSAALAPVLLTLGLLSGEAAVGTLGYLFAYALFLEEAPLRARVRSLLPYALVFVVWTAAYKLLGYGSHDSSFYVDPGDRPLPFLYAMVTRIPTLVLAALVGPPADFWAGVRPQQLPPLVAGAALLIAPMAFLMARALRKDRVAAFFATGALLSLVPMCATLPNDRLLLFPALGLFGVMALFLARARETGAGRSTRVLAGVFVFVHLLVSPLLLPLRCTQFAHIFGSYVANGDATMPAYGPDSTLIVVNAPDLLISTYVGVTRTLRGGELPRAQRLLATAIDGNNGVIERVDARTVAITLERGFLDDPFGRVARGDTAPMHAGEVVPLTGMTTTVEEVTADGRPRRVRFEFDRPLEDPSYVWTRWEGRGYVPTRPPPLGTKESFPPIDFMAIWMGKD